MQDIELYQDRLIYGIKVSFSNLSPEDERYLKMLDSYLWGLKYNGNADFQPENSRVYDSAVIELHTMAYAYSLQKPQFAGLLKKMIEKLYQVTIDNQELSKLHNINKGDVIPEKFKLDHISKPRFKVGHYDYTTISKKNQKQIDILEPLDQLASQRTPKKILKKYTENPKKFNNIFPVFDADAYRLSIIFIFISEANPGDADCFSCFGMLLKKIFDTCKENTSLRVKLYRRKQNG